VAVQAAINIGIYQKIIKFSENEIIGGTPDPLLVFATILLGEDRWEVILADDLKGVKFLKH
jgi:hypothetical protein